MGLWDDLNEAVRKARQDAQKKAAKAAAEQTWKAVKRKVADIGDDFLDAAEAELKEQEGEAEPGLAALPSTAAADARAKAMEERLAGLDRSARDALSRGRSVREEREAREASAREQLEALKKKMGKE